MAESISEGTLKQWLKKKGDYVEVDEEVATIETDKVSLASTHCVTTGIELVGMLRLMSRSMHLPLVPLLNSLRKKKIP